MSCLDEHSILAYIEGQLEPGGIERVEAHLEGCADCGELVAWSARAIGSAPRLTYAEEKASSEDEAPLRRGGVVGRYLLLGPIGRGAMGVVWSAYDPELERKVAIKLMRPDRDRSADEVEVRARITREAQALARVSHPNVIAVYDVGTVDRQVFIAMEQVSGATLSDWLRAEPRSTIEILDVFHQAGLGLAAAHSAGIVHRDFKPANMLIGVDRRVRVLDFGLARATPLVEPSELDPIALIESSELDSSDTLTRTGALLGTPAYMAPEQREARRPDARADQYSFCVALSEALTGKRPRDPRDPALRERRISSWLRKVLVRGLDSDRELRFRTMDALLSALERDPAALRARWLGAAALLLLAVVAGGALRVALRDRARACGDGEQRLAGVWDEARRVRLRAGFAASKEPYARAAAQSASALLDGFASGWMGMYRESCQLTRVRGEQSEELFDLRMACLSDRLVDLQATTDLLVAAGPSAIRKAVAIAGDLPPLSDCGDVKALRGLVRPPRDEAIRRRLNAISDEVASARVLEAAGEYEGGLALVGPVVTQLTAIHYPPALGEALYVRGELEHDLGRDQLAERSYTEAALAAEEGRDDRGLVRARAALARTISRLGRREDGLRWASFAEVGLARIGEDPLLRADVFNVRASIMDDLGRWEEARRDAEQVLALRERALGTGHREVGVALTNLGVIAHDQGRLDEALAYYVRAHALFEPLLGPSHPDLGTVMNNIGNTLADLGRLPEAVTWLERALALRLAGLGPGHRSVAGSRMDLGHVLRRSGALEAALAEEQQALHIAEGAYPANHPWLAFPLVEIGEAQLALGKPLLALAPLERALALPARKRPQKPEVRFPLAQALWASGRDRRRAEQLLGETVAAYDRSVPADALRLEEVKVWSEAHHVKIELSTGRSALDPRIVTP